MISSISRALESDQKSIKSVSADGDKSKDDAGRENSDSASLKSLSSQSSQPSSLPNGESSSETSESLYSPNFQLLAVQTSIIVSVFSWMLKLK